MAKPSDLPEFNTNETRTTAPTTSMKSDGWVYDNEYPSEFDRPDGNTFNYWMNLAYKWIKASNDLGILNYDAVTDYGIGAVVTGSDGLTYQAKIANGASSAVVNPVGDVTGTWFGQFEQILTVADQKTQSTVGGDFTAGAWQTRVLNTEISNTIAGSSLSSNVITLPIGSYSVLAFAPAYKVELNQAVLYNNTESSIELIGSSETADDTGNVQVESKIIGEFTITSENDFIIQHQCSLTKTGNGFGRACNFTTESYTSIKIKKIG